MAHWIETYPHTIYASVLLKDDKIINWKVGQRKWDHPLAMTRMIKLPFDPQDYDNERVEFTSWVVNNDEEHNEVFNMLSAEWFKQWEIHKECEGFPPY